MEENIPESTSPEDTKGGSPTSADRNSEQTSANESTAVTDDDFEKPTHSNTRVHRNPKELVSQGISFFSGLSETLKSPEATQQLIENIVEVDAETGETNIKIPVANKETVSNVLQLLGKLFGGQ